MQPETAMAIPSADIAAPWIVSGSDPIELITVLIPKNAAGIADGLRDPASVSPPSISSVGVSVVPNDVDKPHVKSDIIRPAGCGTNGDHSAYSAAISPTHCAPLGLDFLQFSGLKSSNRIHRAL